ncbi:redox-sensing transcriptional repressor Rex [Pseudothermotoga sp.]|nr:redox-sensing transcriptional repressor Rex [Pseudothermotoga sp.]MCX7813633.1 redox-sensing transcriptional repressor Rex [Pseudothermotoga sp.]MDW8139963.1 redox-sensing transcriptional repressor Rex [Pseudothermotoga sp.]
MLPKPTFERLKLYHRLLLDVDEEYISSESIARILKVQPEQVRKDLSYLKTVGKPKVGYRVDELKKELDELFGVRKETNVIIVGAGRLGTALANYPGFERYGIEIVGIFDNDPQKIGQFVSELVVLPLKDLKRVVKRFNVEIGVICVPKESAQEVANLLVACGIRGIWNFAPVNLEVPSDVLVVNEDITQSLLTLKHLLNIKHGKV